MLNSECEHLSLVGIDTCRYHYGLYRHDRTASHTYEVAVGLIAVHDKREDVNIYDIGTYDNRTGTVFFQRFEACLETHCRLETQAVGRLLHLALQIALYGTGVAFQNGGCHCNELGIFGLALSPDTRGLAVADMVLQTGLVSTFVYLLLGEIQTAGAQRNNILDKLQNRFLGRYRAVGAIVLRAVSYQLSSRLYSWEWLGRNGNPRVGFIVFEQDVVARLQTLNQRVFQQ